MVIIDKQTQAQRGKATGPGSHGDEGASTHCEPHFGALPSSTSPSAQFSLPYCVDQLRAEVGGAEC